MNLAFLRTFAGRVVLIGLAIRIADYFVGLAKKAQGNVSEMARKAGMERHHVRAFLRKYGIER